MRKIVLLAVLVLIISGCKKVSEEEKDWSEVSTEEVIALANNGDAVAQAELGTRYHEGSGVEQDYAEAAKWWMKAAEQGMLRRNIS